jgi:Rrf2 family protein
MISKKAKYAINALVYLAKKYNQGPVLISEIAEHENIPQKFLESILLELKKKAFLASKKGKGGGYYLLKSPKEVNMAELIRTIDGPLAPLPCVSYRYYERCEECKDEETCGIRNVFLELRDSTVRILEGATLEKIVERESSLNPDSPQKD